MTFWNLLAFINALLFFNGVWRQNMFFKTQRQCMLYIKYKIAPQNRFLESTDMKCASTVFQNLIFYVHNKSFLYEKCWKTKFKVEFGKIFYHLFETQRQCMLYFKYKIALQNRFLGTVVKLSTQVQLSSLKLSTGQLSS